MSKFEKIYIIGSNYYRMTRGMYTTLSAMSYREILVWTEQLVNLLPDKSIDRMIFEFSR